MCGCLWKVHKGKKKIKQKKKNEKKEIKEKT
jgi:hypothetical protein